MRFEKHISVSVDIIGFMDYLPTMVTTHPYLGFTPPFSIPMVPFGEIATTMAWIPGMFIGKNKLSSNVLHKDWSIVLDGHDVGPLVPHVFSAPPDNIHLAIQTIQSSRKSNFCAGEVICNGTPIACCTIFELAIPTPMSACSITPCPMLGSGMSVLTNSVIVGMHWIDVVAGWVGVIIDSLISIAFIAAGGSKPGWLPNPWAIVPGLIRLAGQEWAGYHGDAKMEIKVELGPASRSVSLERSGTDGRWTAASEGQLGPSLAEDGAGGVLVGDGLARDVANVHDRESVSWGGDGGEGVVVTGQGGGSLLGQSGDVGVSNRRPGDNQPGFFGSGTSTWGSGQSPLGPALEGIPE